MEKRYSIIFSSLTGNTRKLADQIHEVLPAETCDYFGEAKGEEPSSEVLYVGFWTDKGNADGPLTSGHILMASGRVPNTNIIFFI